MSVPKNFGTGGALPRDISLSGEYEERPVLHFAGLLLSRGAYPLGQAARAVHSRGLPGEWQPISPEKTLISYFRIFATTPAPTVRPPSRIAKRRPSSIAMGWISSTTILMLSPGMTISTPSGSVTAPVMSVVRK
jgi:hypothetical protein